MEQAKALAALSEGHAMWNVEHAIEVCEALGVEFEGCPIEKWEGQADANPDNHPKGLWLDEDKPGRGVNSLSLSAHVARQMYVMEGSRSFFGRGTQAREYAKLVREKLKKEGKLEKENA